MNSKILSIVGALSLTAFSAAQACEISARVSVVGNEFPAIQTVGAGAAACTGADVSTKSEILEGRAALAIDESPIINIRKIFC